jgi:NAD(P)-dependent dehydrogenase (short-subunit alcohol dehydrogenase family)
MAHRNPLAFGSFVYRQLTAAIPVPNHSFIGQTVIITGANTGLGFEAAIHIVRAGAEKVILGVRSLTKGEAAKTNIESRTGKQDIIEVWQLDLASYDSVKAFVRRAEGLKRLDVVLENAGMLTEKFSVAEDNESAVWRFASQDANHLQDDIDCQRGVNILVGFDDIAEASRECNEFQNQTKNIDCLIIGTPLHRIVSKISCKDL